MRVRVYVDGFNLYGGALRNTPYRWLDLDALSRRLLPDDTIDQILYFTAATTARTDDPTAPSRQAIYWRALRTLGNVEFVEGKFYTKRTNLPTVASVDDLRRRQDAGEDVTGLSPDFVAVYRSEEKGTDVSLAVRLVHDAHLGRFEAALVVSNDSDLVEAVRIVRHEIGRVVGIATPHRRVHSVQLKGMASFFRELKASDLKECQFPDELADADGTFRKPIGW